MIISRSAIFGLPEVSKSFIICKTLLIKHHNFILFTWIYTNKTHFAAHTNPKSCIGCVVNGTYW